LGRRYRLLERLGRGASGEVFRAVDRGSGREVAIKLIPRGHRAARLPREVAALQALDVPGVVRLLDAGEAGDRAFLAMELVEGAPFPALPTPAPWAALAPRARALLETVARVHAVGVVHRDLKPANVLVSPAGQPYVLDFGLARTAGDFQTLTATGALLGTPRYMSPEQCRGQRGDARSDLYALGVMLYEALAGALPQRLEGWPALLALRLGEEPRPLRALAPDVPEAVASVIDRMVARALADRFPSVVAALRALEDPDAAGGLRLPLLGRARALSALTEAIAAGRSVDVGGPPGVGKSRLMDEAARRLGARPIARLRPARRPLGSLGALWEGSAGAGRSASEVQAAARAVVEAFLEGGGVIFADDDAALDSWTLSARRARRRSGASPTRRSSRSWRSPTPWSTPRRRCRRSRRQRSRRGRRPSAPIQSPRRPVTA